jgi:hypothetical protein
MSKMANYDMGLVSNVPSDGSFIYYSLGKLLHGNLGKGVFEFFFFFFSFSFLQDRYNAEVIDVRYLILSWVDVV